MDSSIGTVVKGMVISIENDMAPPASWTSGSCTNPSFLGIYATASVVIFV